MRRPAAAVRRPTWPANKTVLELTSEDRPRTSRRPAHRESGRVPRRGVADHSPSPPLQSRPVRAAAVRRAITAGPGSASPNRAADEGDSGRDLRIPPA